MKTAWTALFLGFWAGCSAPPPDRIAEIMDREPPAPQAENPGPDRPGHSWCPGRWTWSGSSWMWLPGRHLARPAADSVWSPGRWERRGKYWVWIEGRWH